MTDVVIIYDADCPNRVLARERVRSALARVGLPDRWRELDRADDATPIAWRSFASPTVLVGGLDVERGVASSHAACRVYTTDGALAGAPSVDTIAAALRRGEPL